MRSSFRSTLGPAIALAFAFVAAACGEGATDPTGLRLSALDGANTITTETTVGSPVLNDPTEWYRRIWVCKVGTNADFTVTVNGGTPTAVAILDGYCKMVHYMDSADPLRVDTVTVTETYNAATVLDSIVVDSTHGATKFRLPTITGTNEVRTYTFRSKGAIATFYNSLVPPPPPPEGGQGCTPGYWKQSQHFDSWTAPYTPNTLFSAVFANAFPGKTLLQVLGNGGGDLDALGRHTVAALLNTASAGVEYDFSTAGVIAAFNTAYANGNHEAQKNIFARFNEQGCPLN